MTAGSKTILRAQLGAARKALTAADIAALSARITEHLRRLPRLVEARQVAVYLAMPHEVQTAPLIASLRAQGIALSIPVFDPARDEYHFAQLPPDDAALTHGPLGIPQPTHPTWVDPASISAVIVPGVAFAPDGTRLGHGAGVYDRLLTKCPGAPIGIAFTCQLVAHLPAEPHDIPMHWIVTEHGAQAATPLSEQKHETTTQ